MFGGYALTIILDPFITIIRLNVETWAQEKGYDQLYHFVASPPRGLVTMWDYATGNLGLGIVIGAVIVAFIPTVYEWFVKQRNRSEEAASSESPTENPLVPAGLVKHPVSEEATPTPPTPLPDPAKRAAIDEIYESLKEAEGVIDGNPLNFGPNWKLNVIELGVAGYCDKLQSFRIDVSNKMRVVSDLCEHKHGIFSDIRDFRFRSGKEFRDLNLGTVELMTKLRKLPNDASETTLGLLDDDMKALGKVRGIALKWVRDSMTTFREMRDKT